jgi:DNA-binding Lrp family transcriptional regulator
MKTASKETYKKILPHKETHQQRILKTLGQSHMTYRTIAHHSGLKESQVWKRLIELERDHKIMECGTVNGFTVYKLVTTENKQLAVDFLDLKRKEKFKTAFENLKKKYPEFLKLELVNSLIY